MASLYRKNLTGKSEILSKKDHDELATHSRQLQQARNDLQGMAYERVVIDVISREAVLSATRGSRKLRKANTVEPGSRYNKPRVTSVGSKTDRPAKEPVNAPTLDDPIPIPSYNARKQNKPKAPPTGPTDSTPTSAPLSRHTGRVAVGSGPVTGRMTTGVLPTEIAHLHTTPAVRGGGGAKRVPRKRPGPATG